MTLRRCIPCVLAVGLLVGCRDKPRPPPPAPTTTSSASAGASKATTQFWSWFAEHAAALHDDPDLRATMETISEQLEKVDPGVFAEIGKEGDDRVLVLTVDGKKELFPTVKEIHAARPKVPGWKIVAFRQRAEPMAIEMNGKKLDPKTIKVLARKDDDKLGLTVYIPGFTTLDDFGMGPFIVLDHTVGEYDMETKIGAIDFTSTDKVPDDARPLSELPAILDKAIPPAP
jgi:hypothetical protein